MTYTEIIEVLNDLPVLIRHQRRRRNQSVRAAADEIGVSFSTLSRWERWDSRDRQTPTPKQISELFAVLRWLKGADES